MTTISRRQKVGGVETIQKPTMISQINEFMGGVDKSDQLITYYGFYHHSKKWWKLVFFFTLLMCLSWMLILPTARWQQVDNSHIWNSDFKWLKDWLRGDGAVRALPETPGDAMHMPVCLVRCDHYPEPGKTQDCRVCSRKDRLRKQTSFQCCICKVPLCVHLCFLTFIPTRSTSRISIHAHTLCVM